MAFQSPTHTLTHDAPIQHSSIHPSVVPPITHPSFHLLPIHSSTYSSVNHPSASQHLSITQPPIIHSLPMYSSSITHPIIYLTILQLSSNCLSVCLFIDPLFIEPQIIAPNEALLCPLSLILKSNEMSCPWTPPPSEREGRFVQRLHSEHEPCWCEVEGTLA